MRPRLLTWFTTLIAIYHIVIAGRFLSWFDIFVPAQIHRAISLCSALILIFIWQRMREQAKKEETSSPQSLLQGIPWYDYVFILSTLIGSGFIVFFYQDSLMYSMFGFLDTKGEIVALVLCLPLLEAVRRKTGWSFPIIILCFVFAALFQQYLPGILSGRGYSLDRLLYSSYIGTSGIFGLPLGVAANIIIVFMIFGALIQLSGAGKWFMDLALAMTGWARGGPAKAAVVSSALFGMISGSPSGNAATVGVFTVPLMMKAGYKPKFAAAVEACASTGGQILPPVMGAIAFVMAEWIGVPYSQVALAAAIPAILYFLVLFISVHFQAHKDNINPIPRSELPKFGEVFRSGWFFLIPFLALIYFLLIKHYEPEMACIYSLPFLIGSSFLSKDRSTWLNGPKMIDAFYNALRSWVGIAAVTGAVGIMVGALELSGLGIKFSAFTLDISGGNLLLTLLLVGIACLIIGTALDSIPSYIVLATLMAPALVKMGVPVIAAHLFVIYWGLASFITPPVALSVFVACGISGSKIWETGWVAMKIGLAAYLVPFAFVLNPALLLQGTTFEILFATITAIVGCSLLACGVCGFALTLMNVTQRTLLILSGLLFIIPGIYYLLAGLVIALLVIAWQKVNLRIKKNPPMIVPQ
jgi:TRAP transporter 4TM/12TM fusion protein